MEENKEINTVETVEEADFGLEKIRKRYRIKGTDDYIEIDLGDINLPGRAKEAQKNITDYMTKNTKKAEKADKEKNIDAQLKLLTDCDIYVKNQINYIFKSDVCKIIFGDTSSISVTREGEYYFECFLNAAFAIIEKEYDVRMTKLSLRTKAYTDKKGMHPAYKK